MDSTQGQIFSIEWVNEALENYSFSLQDCLHPYPHADLYIPVCQNEHDIVVYTLGDEFIDTGLTIWLVILRLLRDIKLVKIHISDFKTALPLTAMLIFCQCQYALHFWIVSPVKTGIDVNVSYYTMAQTNCDSYSWCCNRSYRSKCASVSVTI